LQQLNQRIIFLEVSFRMSRKHNFYIRNHCFFVFFILHLNWNINLYISNCILIMFPFLFFLLLSFLIANLNRHFLCFCLNYSRILLLHSFIYFLEIYSFLLNYVGYYHLSFFNFWYIKIKETCYLNCLVMDLNFFYIFIVLSMDQFHH